MRAGLYPPLAVRPPHMSCRLRDFRVFIYRGRRWRQQHGFQWSHGVGRDSARGHGKGTALGTRERPEWKSRQLPGGGCALRWEEKQGPKAYRGERKGD